MNILGIFPAFRSSEHVGPVGGGEISNRQLLEEMASRGHAVTVYAFNAGTKGERTEGGVRVIDGGMGRPEGITKKIFRAAHMRRSLRTGPKGCSPDVILTSVSTVGAGLNLSRRYEAPMAVLVRALRDMEPPAVSATKSLARHLLYGSSNWTDAKCLIANSNYLLDQCRQGGFEGCGWVVYPPVDAAIVKTGWPSVVKSICMVGSSAQKGAGIFLSLAARMPDISFRVIGDRSVAPGAAQVVGNLTRVGWTNTPLAEIDACDALFMPTQTEEAFGRAAVEAVLRKKFVIASKVGGLPEAVADPFLLVAPKDFDAWEERVLKLVGDPAAFIPAMESALETAKSFGITAQADRFERALYEMSAPTSRTRR